MVKKMRKGGITKRANMQPKKHRAKKPPVGPLTKRANLKPRAKRPGRKPSGKAKTSSSSSMKSKDKVIYIASRGEIMREAWKIARQLFNVFGKDENMPSTARDYLGVALKKQWKISKIVVKEPADLPTSVYCEDEVIQDLVAYTHNNRGTSSTFWLNNKEDDGSLQLSKYQIWKDGDDKTVADVMTDYSNISFFGEGYWYNPLTDQVESKAPIETDAMELNFDDIIELMNKAKK